MDDLTNKKCAPCEKGADPLTEAEAMSLIQKVSGWELFENAHAIRKEFKFKNFKEGMVFVNKVAELAEGEGHHPDIHIKYSLVGIEISTHAIGGLSENDFILAAKIDKIT